MGTPTPSPDKGERRVVGKSPSSGKISIIQPPQPAVPTTTTTTTSTEPSTTSSYRTEDVRKELKHQEIEIGDNLGNHKIGGKFQNHLDDNGDYDAGEDYVEISLKEKHLQDLTNFVNGGKSPKVKDKSKTTINLGVRKVVNYDYNELFDDVIETTPATDIFEDNIEWGQKLWAEVANDFEPKEDETRQRQKIKVKKQRKTTVKPISTISPKKKNDDDDARLLSIWAAAEKVSENGPSLRFESEEEESYENPPEDNKRSYQTNRLPSKSLEEKTRNTNQGFYNPSKVTQQFFCNNFRGFQMKKDIPDRDFYGGFKPSTLDLDNDLTSSESIRRSDIHQYHKVE